MPSASPRCGSSSSLPTYSEARLELSTIDPMSRAQLEHFRLNDHYCPLCKYISTATSNNASRPPTQPPAPAPDPAPTPTSEPEQDASPLLSQRSRTASLILFFAPLTLPTTLFLLRLALFISRSVHGPSSPHWLAYMLLAHRLNAGITFVLGLVLLGCPILRLEIEDRTQRRAFIGFLSVVSGTVLLVLGVVFWAVAY